MSGFARGRYVPMVTCIFVLWLGMGARAHAELRMHWDCYLPNAQVACSEVASAYFPSVAGIDRAASERRANVSVALRSVQVASAERFLVDFRGRPVGADARDDEVRFTLADEVPTAEGHDRTLMRLVGLLQRGTVPYLSVTTPGSSENGVLRLEAAGTSHEEGSTDGSRGRDVHAGWYLRPSLSGEIVSAGMHMVSLSSKLELSYTDRCWRWLTTASGGYRHLDIDLGNEHLSGGFFQGNATSTLAHSLGAGLDLAVIGSARREPQNNLRSRVEGGAGVEWLRHPFLRADGTNFGARYVLSTTWDRYATETVLGQTERVYPRHALLLFAGFHLDAVDFKASVNAGAVADQPELWNVGADLKTTLRVTAGLEIELYGSVLYRGGAVHEPADPGRLDPIATIISGSDFYALTYDTGISLAYTFGNGLLYSQDQRWR